MGCYNIRLGLSTCFHCTDKRKAGCDGSEMLVSQRSRQKWRGRLRHGGTEQMRPLTMPRFGLTPDGMNDGINELADNSGRSILLCSSSAALPVFKIIDLLSSRIL